MFLVTGYALDAQQEAAESLSALVWHWHVAALLVIFHENKLNI